MSRLATLSIRSLILLITCVVALPAAGIILYSGIQFRNQMLQDARLETVKLSDRIATEQQNLSSGAEQLMTALAQLPEVKNRDARLVETVLRDLLRLNPMYMNIHIADRNGTVWASALPVKQPFVVADRRYFRNALDTGRFSSGEYIVTRSTSQPGISLAYPLKNDRGATLGVLSITFNLNRYREMLTRQALPDGTSFSLLDHSGMILSRGINPEPYIGKRYMPAEFEKMKQGPESGTSIRPGFAGDQRIISYRKLRLAGEATPYLYVTAGIPVEVATRQANQALLNSVVLLSSFLLLACAAAVLIGKRAIVDRFKLLENASQRLAAGDLQVRVSDLVAGGELGSLGKRFDFMAQELAKREEARLQTSEELERNSYLLSETQKLARLGSWELDLLSGAFHWTEQIYRIFEIAPESFAGTYRAFLDLVHPDDRERVKQTCRKSVREGTPFDMEHRLLMPDGRVKVVQERGETEYRDGAPRRTIGSVQDITQLRVVEEAQKKLACLVEMSRDFISLATLEGGVIYLNQAGIALVGLADHQEACSKDVVDFFPPESAGWYDATVRPELALNGYWEGEASLLNFRTGEPVAVEMTVFTVSDEAGRPIAQANVSRDLRERRAADAERDLLTEQLIQAQKMESIGQLAGGVAHDFNNLLTPIFGYSEFLKRDLPGNEEALAKVANILRAAGKAKDLVQQLLSFSRKQVLEMNVIDLGQVVAGFQNILHHTIRESIEIRLSLSPEPYGIRADRNKIEQVLMNLAVNAQDAIDGCGVIRIETAPVLLDDEYARQHPGVVPGRYLMLAVSDDGCGMDQETRQRIFEPFFTTKGVGKGTGLGLATVYGIVRQHGGNLWVYSEPGKGTTFRCYFPLVDGLPQQERATLHGALTLAGGRRTVLLVEDNEMVRNFVDELLTRQGFEVLAAEDPKKALQLAQDREFELLITDVVMPHMTGFQLYAKLAASCPGLKVLYMSGYNDHGADAGGLPGCRAHFIEKPFAISEFASKVEALLEA
jgi:two-component system, cell cycle sensor histidine kinase and response regulator CckA